VNDKSKNGLGRSNLGLLEFGIRLEGLSKTMNTSVTIANDLAEIRTDRLPNTSVELYR
jgi:hypothetical protein